MSFENTRLNDIIWFFGSDCVLLLFASISLRSDSCIPSLRREHSEADLSIAYLNHLSITPLPQLPASHSRLIMLLRTAIRPSAFRSIAKSIPAAPIRSPFNRPVAIAFGLSLGATPFLHPRTTARLDSSPSSPQAAEFSSTPYTHSRDARTPLTKDGRTLNPAAVKQISLGAILGLGAGVLLSAFSRMLTLIIGLGIVIWQVSTKPH